MQTPEDVMAAYARTAREARSQPLQVRFEESTLMSGGDSTEDHPFDDDEPLELDEGDSPSLTGPPAAPPPPSSRASLTSVASVASTRTVGPGDVAAVSGTHRNQDPPCRSLELRRRPVRSIIRAAEPGSTCAGPTAGAMPRARATGARARRV